LADRAVFIFTSSKVCGQILAYFIQVIWDCDVFLENVSPTI